MHSKLFFLLAGIGGLLGWVPASAQLAGPGAIKANNCAACHQIHHKRVGPPFQQIANRYAGVPDGASYLANSIRTGSRGKWGSVPMPAQSQVSEDQARTIAEWILTLSDKNVGATKHVDKGALK